MVIFTPLNYSAHINNGRALWMRVAALGVMSCRGDETRAVLRHVFKAVFSSK